MLPDVESRQNPNSFIYVGILSALRILWLQYMVH